VFYRFLWFVLRPFLLLPFRVRFVGRERVPAGGLVLAPNHESYLDPVLVGLGLWRPVHFMAKEELWHNVVLAWVVTAMNTFPVKRGRADRAALAEAARLLEAGEQIGIFPQGTRHHAHGLEGLEEGAGGTALIALRAGRPVVPVGIHGTDRIKPPGSRFIRFPRVTVVYGAPIDPAGIPEGQRRERVDDLTRRIMEGIAAAVEEASAEGGRR
jgi:1-acyl-sn-glycerol-3-phosphate acyltransferase